MRIDWDDNRHHPGLRIDEWRLNGIQHNCPPTNYRATKSNITAIPTGH